MVKLRRARQAKELFENCNLRMVAKIANRYMAQGVDMEVLPRTQLAVCSLELPGSSSLSDVLVETAQA